MRDVNKPFPGSKKMRVMQYSADAAETFALTALGWLVAQPDLLPVFLGATGAEEADLRARVASWSVHSGLHWGTEEISAVTGYLNRRFYQLVP